MEHVLSILAILLTIYFYFSSTEKDQVHISGDLLLAIIQTLIQVCGERYVGDVM